jgi:hypothetical protein
MDFLILLIRQATEMLKSFITAITPAAIYIYTIVVPLITNFVSWVASINFYKIFTSYLFIGLILLILGYIVTYLYLRIYQPELYKKIREAITFKNDEKKKRYKFVFETDLDFKISS